jgi:hypothetical protein
MTGVIAETSAATRVWGDQLISTTRAVFAETNAAIQAGSRQLPQTINLPTAEGGEELRARLQAVRDDLSAFETANASTRVDAVAASIDRLIESGNTPTTGALQQMASDLRSFEGSTAPAELNTIAASLERLATEVAATATRPIDLSRIVDVGVVRDVATAVRDQTATARAAVRDLALGLQTEVDQNQIDMSQLIASRNFAGLDIGADFGTIDTRALTALENQALMATAVPLTPPAGAGQPINATINIYDAVNPKAVGDEVMRRLYGAAKRHRAAGTQVGVTNS